jgi:carbamoyl-phosphate synthase large subunit
MGALSGATVLVTGSGAPGFPGTCYSLREAAADVTVVGTDARTHHAGRYFADDFQQVPLAEDEDFVPALLEVCRRGDVDVVVPQVTRELPVLADARSAFEEAGTPVVVSDPSTVELANDKHRLAGVAQSLGVPTPETHQAETGEQLERAATSLGYPAEPVVVKPPVSNGSRGVRILDATRDRKRAFYEEKPDGRYATLDGVRETLGEAFPPLLVMEYLPGEEYTVDAFRPRDGETATTVVPRRRDSVKAGISFGATPVDDADMVAHSRALASELGLTGAFGFQFKADADGNPCLLECNPRVQGTMVTSTVAGANVVAAAVRDALGESVSPMTPAWGVRFLRYWGGVGVADGDVTDDLGGQAGREWR